MSFCSKCGAQVPESVNFCGKCGNVISIGKQMTAQAAAVDANDDFKKIWSDDSRGKPMDVWVWILAIFPIIDAGVRAILTNTLTFGAGDAETFILAWLCWLIILLDMRGLTGKGYQWGIWHLLSSLLLPPAYLFVRASKTNKKYAYAIVGCVFLVLAGALADM